MVEIGACGRTDVDDPALFILVRPADGRMTLTMIHAEEFSHTRRQANPCFTPRTAVTFLRAAAVHPGRATVPSPMPCKEGELRYSNRVDAATDAPPKTVGRRPGRFRFRNGFGLARISKKNKIE